MLPNIDYVNVNDLKDEVAAAMEEDERLGQDVYKQESGVHIPIEIYEGCELDFFLVLFYGREEKRVIGTGDLLSSSNGT